MLSRFSSRGISSATSTWKSHGLADQTDGVGAAHRARRKRRIVGGAAARALGHAESGEAGVFQRRALGEERRVGRVGAGPAAFDIIDAEVVQRQRDLALVFDREIDALRLRPVAQRGVEEIEAFVRCSSLSHLPCRALRPVLQHECPWPAVRRGCGRIPSKSLPCAPRCGLRWRRRLRPCRILPYLGAIFDLHVEKPRKPNAARHPSLCLMQAMAMAAAC